MSESTDRMGEPELLDVISGLKPNSVRAIEVVYEAISLPNFSMEEVCTAAGIDPSSGMRSVVKKAAIDLALFTRTEVKQVRHQAAHKPTYYKTTPLAYRFAAAHNRLHIRLIKDVQDEKLPDHTIFQRSLNGFAANLGLQGGDVVALAKESRLHPSTVVHRALGAYATALGTHSHILAARARLVKTHEAKAQ